ncbi:hypothetical protein LguiA_021032 [Lonicera macranthoides]
MERLEKVARGEGERRLVGEREGWWEAVEEEGEVACGGESRREVVLGAKREGERGVW